MEIIHNIQFDLDRLLIIQNHISEMTRASVYVLLTTNMKSYMDNLTAPLDFVMHDL